VAGRFNLQNTQYFYLINPADIGANRYTTFLLQQLNLLFYPKAALGINCHWLTSFELFISPNYNLQQAGNFEAFRYVD
jgi:hypothetical protein